jgi:nitrogen fixation/metabolism regulation signal transduction histidine kinase
LSHENWLITGLSITVICLLSLTGALFLQLGWSNLAISTLLFSLSYPLIWFAWRCYWFWCQIIMQLSTYTQILREGEHNLHFKQQHPDNLLLELQKEIAALADVNLRKHLHDQSVDSLLNQVLDSWPIPVCLFDHDFKLTYRNSAMNEQLHQPMLLGSFSTNLGFTLKNNNFIHPMFDQKWQCQTISYLKHMNGEDKKQWLFSAIDISQLLHQAQSTTQQSLIRVLGHEIRNSLTPMYSMTDTLLSSEHLDEQQTLLVLTRIKKRSNRLLSFISEYSRLAQLPSPKLKWFNFIEILNEAESMLNASNCNVTFHGNEQCFGDMEQIAQVMINLLKNAFEACESNKSEIEVKVYYQQEQQIIEISDNGPGFANLDNVLTPFYTTKQHGSGIGLSLCAEIARNHGGQLKVSNNNQGSAKITMHWPMNNNLSSN